MQRVRNFSIKVPATIAIQDLLPDCHPLLMNCFRPRGGTMFSDSADDEVEEEYFILFAFNVTGDVAISMKNVKKSHLEPRTT